jgi:hypothetical protein
MHVKFEFTQEDMVDTARRCIAHSEAATRWRLKGWLGTIVLAWLGTFIVLSLLQRPLLGAIVGLPAAMISGLLYPELHRRGVEKRLREFHREKFGDAGPFVCEVEVGPVGVWVRQFNTTATHEWESIEGVEDARGGIEILTSGGGLVLVRDRAFHSPEERRRFLELARGYFALAGGGDPDARLTASR